MRSRLLAARAFLFCIVVSFAPAHAQSTPSPLEDRTHHGGLGEVYRRALSTSGLLLRGQRLDALVARARWSALLPELHARWGRWTGESDGSDSNDKNYETVRSGVHLELRVGWSLERLVFAHDEVAIERLRGEDLDLRWKLLGRVSQSLATFYRARIHRQSVAPDSLEYMEADAQVFESQAALDELTGGWFSVWVRTSGETRAGP